MAASDVEYRCFVGGLAWATDDNSLHNAFSPYGEVLESKVRPVIHLPSLPLFPLPCMMISFGWEEKTRFLKEEKWGAVQICGAGGFAELDLVFLFFFLT